jgi:hypothetical protein
MFTPQCQVGLQPVRRAGPVHAHGAAAPVAEVVERPGCGRALPAPEAGIEQCPGFVGTEQSDARAQHVLVIARESFRQPAAALPQMWVEQVRQLVHGGPVVA